LFQDNFSKILLIAKEKVISLSKKYMNSMKSRTAKLAAGFVGIAMAVSFIAPAIASADTASDLQAQINSLLATIQSLQAQLAATTGGSASTGYTFNTNLTVGSTGADVMNLQKVLNMSADTRVAASGVGSPGNESSYFGALTKAAVVKFQLKNGISPAAGYVGPITRAKLNSMNTGTPTVPGTNPQGGSVSVSAGAQPANSLAPQSAARVPFTTVVLTAGSSDVTVNSITVERSGLAQDAVFAGVVLLNSDGTQIGIAKTLNSNHQALVGEPFVVKAGTSKTVTVAGNMAASLSSYAGQVAGLNVVAVNTSASVSGSMPITGAMHTINASLTLGTVTMNVSSYDPNTSQTKEIGTTGYKFAGVRVTAGSAEQVRLWTIRWNQSGSASSNDLSNVKVYVDGTAYDTTVSADGKYYTAAFSGGILIDKGLSKDIYIQGDITGSGAAGRTVKFDIYKTTDLYLTGVTYGYGITPPVGASSASNSTSEFTATTPWFDGSLVTVSAGSVTSIQKATSVAAQNIAVNVPNQVLGGFVADIKGEPITVQSMVFTIATTGTWTSSTGITNITLVNENGAVVAGPVDEANSCTSGCSITFTDSVTLPIGAHTYTLKGKIPTGAPNGATVVVSATPSSGWTNVTGQTTGNTISLSSNGNFSMNTMTVKSASLTVSVSSSPAAQSIVPGGRVTFTNYQFDASDSGEDVRFGVLPVAYDQGNNGTAAAPSKMTSCQLYDGATALNTGSNVLNPSATSDATTTSPLATSVTLDSQYTVPKGTVKTLSFACNVSSSADNASVMQWGLTNGVAMTVTGVTSGADVSESLTTANGSLMTVSTGSFAVSIDSSTSNYMTVAGGSTGVTIGTFKFRASNEAVSLQKVGLTLSTSTPSDLGTVYLYNGATLVGTATFTGAATTATSTLSSPLTLTKDTDVLLTIKADLANIGSSDTGTEGRLVKIDVTNAEGSGASSGTTLRVAGVSAGVNGVRMFKSFPVVASDTLPSTGVADGRLMRFKITADSHGPVGLFSLDFTIATSSFASGGGVTLPKVMVYSDASYSLPVSGSYGAATGQFGSTGYVSTSGNSGSFTASTTGSYVPLQIPAGTTYYFQVEATVQSTQTGTSVTTTLNGDAAYIDPAHLNIGTVGPTVPLTSSTTGAIADTNNDFIWSGNATSTTGVNGNDWANGYGILGLPSGGFSTTRSN
jgi:hypothetical protein